MENYQISGAKTGRYNKVIPAVSQATFEVETNYKVH